MSASAKDKSGLSYLAKSVEFDSDMMHVRLTDGRINQRSDYLVSEIASGKFQRTRKI